MKHVSHFNQRITIYSRNKTFVCKVFTSSLKPIVMRWFNGLEEGSIASYEKLTRAFGARFMTCSGILKPLDSQLSMAVRRVKSLKIGIGSYLTRLMETSRMWLSKILKWGYHKFKSEEIPHHEAC